MRLYQVCALKVRPRRLLRKGIRIQKLPLVGVFALDSPTTQPNWIESWRLLPGKKECCLFRTHCFMKRQSWTLNLTGTTIERISTSLLVGTESFAIKQAKMSKNRPAPQTINNERWIGKQKTKPSKKGAESATLEFIAYMND